MNDRPGHYKELAKRYGPKDYWSQVGRIVAGKPVGEDQIQLIVDSILRGLEIGEGDLLLDLCCGNGALTDRIFDRCRGGFGVDYSPPLIEVAKRDFERPGEREYRLQDVMEFLETAEVTEKFNKALCYGSLTYLSLEAAQRFLVLVRERFPKVERLMFGNLPDRTKARKFLGPLYREGIEDDPNSAIGIWRTEEEFVALAEQTGWSCAISRQAPPFFAANYRYDAVLTPLSR